MGLSKRGKYFWVRIYSGGKQVQVSTKTTNKKKAEKIYAKILNDINEQKWFGNTSGESQTFSMLIEKYEREYSAINKAPSTIKREKSTVKHLLLCFGEMKLGDITSRDVAEYKSQRRLSGASPKTVNNELVLMSHAFNIAMKEWEWVRDNPVSRIKKFKVNNLIERWLTEGEEIKLLNASPEWLREIILFATYTGLRQGEIINLKWSLVDFERRTITILEQKNKGVDTLPLNDKAMSVLKARSKVRSISCDHVFFNKAGKVHDSANIIRAFSTTRKKVKLENFRFHDLRHTFATRLVQGGVDIYKVQKLLRHKSPQMTQRYAHHYSESLRDGVEVLDRNNECIGTKLVQCKEKGLQQIL